MYVIRRSRCYPSSLEVRLESVWMLAWIQRVVRMRRSGVGGLIRATSCVPFNLSSGPHVDELSSWLPWLSRSNHAHPPCLTQYCAAVRIVPRTATWHIDAAVLQQYSSVSEPSAKFYIVYCHLLQCFTTGDAFTLICVYELLILILFFVLRLNVMSYNQRCIYVWYVQLNSTNLLTYTVRGVY